MQAHVCQVGLNSVLAALRNHPSDTDIQAKALVVLGVLGQVRHIYCCHAPPPQPPHLLPPHVKYHVPFVAMQDVKHVEHMIMFDQLKCACIWAEL